MTDNTHLLTGPEIDDAIKDCEEHPFKEERLKSIEDIMSHRRYVCGVDLAEGKDVDYNTAYIFDKAGGLVEIILTDPTTGKKQHFKRTQ